MPLIISAPRIHTGVVTDSGEDRDKQSAGCFDVANGWTTARRGNVAGIDPARGKFDRDQVLKRQGPKAVRAVVDKLEVPKHISPNKHSVSEVGDLASNNPVER